MRYDIESFSCYTYLLKVPEKIDLIFFYNLHELFHVVSKFPAFSRVLSCWNEIVKLKSLNYEYLIPIIFINW